MIRVTIIGERFGFFCRTSVSRTGTFESYSEVNTFIEKSRIDAGSVSVERTEAETNKD